MGRKKGFKHTEETKKKIGKGNKGKILSEETKKKISERCGRKGRIPWIKGKKGVNKWSEETKKKMSERMKGNKNPMWKGDYVSKTSLHQWIANYKPKPEFCENCKIKKPYDLANINGEYKRDINDFRWLCRSCHMIMDYKNGSRIGRRI